MSVQYTNRSISKAYFKVRKKQYRVNKVMIYTTKINILESKVGVVGKLDTFRQLFESTTFHLHYPFSNSYS